MRWIVTVFVAAGIAAIALGAYEPSKMAVGAVCWLGGWAAAEIWHGLADGKKM